MLERIKGFFSSSRSQTIRRHLRKSLERGPIYDFKEITDTNGKVWSTKPAQDKAIKSIPADFKIGNISASDLFRRNRATLLAVSYSSFSDPAIASFISGSLSTIPKIIIRPILNPLKWIIWSKLVSAQDDSFTIRGDLPGSIDVFEMENKYAGYVFLIDSFGNIRWKAAGMATPEEIIELNNTIKLLTSF